MRRLSVPAIEATPDTIAAIPLTIGEFATSVRVNSSVPRL